MWYQHKLRLKYDVLLKLDNRKWENEKIKEMKWNIKKIKN